MNLNWKKKKQWNEWPEFLSQFFFFFCFLISCAAVTTVCEMTASFVLLKCIKTTVTSTTVQPVQNTTGGIQLFICWKLKKSHAFRSSHLQNGRRVFPKGYRRAKAPVDQKTVSWSGGGGPTCRCRVLPSAQCRNMSSLASQALKIGRFYQ